MGLVSGRVLDLYREIDEIKSVRTRLYSLTMLSGESKIIARIFSDLSLLIELRSKEIQMVEDRERAEREIIDRWKMKHE